MNKTKIEWVKNPYWEWTDDTGKIHISGGEQGYTWNPITGCLNHVNGMCNGGNFPCYAYRLANGRLKSRYLANTTIPEPAMSGAWLRGLNNPFYPRFWPKRVEAPVHNFRFHRWAERQRYRDRGIFVCDMGELFGDWIPLEWQEQIFETIKQCPNDRFYLLTKQPLNLIKFSPFPDNCWVGVTATDNYHYLRDFEKVEAKVKYISFEPLLDWDTKLTFQNRIFADILQGLGINWVIIGAQTKPYKPPQIEWVQEIVRAADQAGSKVFLKNNLGHSLQYSNNLELIHREDEHGVLVLRQEMPGHALGEFGLSGVSRPALVGPGEGSGETNG